MENNEFDFDCLAEIELAKNDIKINEILNEQNKTISFMESCTGGYLANEITNVSGASNVLRVSLVTYSNEYKIKIDDYNYKMNNCP